MTHVYTFTSGFVMQEHQFLFHRLPGQIARSGIMFTVEHPPLILVKGKLLGMHLRNAGIVSQQSL